MRRYPDRQEVHQFRLHEGEFVRNLQTDEVFEDWMSGKASPQRSPLLVIHDEDEVRPLEHPGIHSRERIDGRVPADRTSRSERLPKIRSAVGLRMRLCRHRNSTRLGGAGVPMRIG